MVTRTLGVMSTLIMARILMPADFGLLAMATTFAATIDSLSQFGLQEALIRRQESDERLHDTAFTLQLGRAVVTAVIIAFCAPVASRWFDEPRLLPILLVLAAASAIAGLQNVGIVAFRRDIDYSRQFVFLCVPRLLQVATTIVLGLTLRSYWALVIGIVLSKSAQTVMSYGVHPYRPRLSFAHWRDLAAFSLWTWAASIGSIIWNRCDPFVIGPAVGAAQLGVYLLAAEVASLPISELVAPAAEVLLGGFSLARRQGSSPAASALPAATTLLFAIMPMMLAISGTAGFIVAALLGPAWTQAGPLIAIAAWLGLFSPYSYICGVALVSANRVRLNFMANCLASLLKLGGLVVAIHFTTDLSVIMTVGVLIVGLESIIFVVALLRGETWAPGPTCASFGRLVASAAATLFLMWISGLAWTPVSVTGPQALLAGGALGAGIVFVFVASAYAVWRAVGKPEGPETKAVSLVLHVAAPLNRRVSGLAVAVARGFNP